MHLSWWMLDRGASLLDLSINGSPLNPKDFEVLFIVSCLIDCILRLITQLLMIRFEPPLLLLPSLLNSAFLLLLKFFKSVKLGNHDLEFVDRWPLHVVWEAQGHVFC